MFHDISKYFFYCKINKIKNTKIYNILSVNCIEIIKNINK